MILQLQAHACMYDSSLLFALDAPNLSCCMCNIHLGTYLSFTTVHRTSRAGNRVKKATADLEEAIATRDENAAAAKAK